VIASRLEQFLEEGSRRVDAALDRLLPPVDVEPKTLHEAIRYSVFAGGKRFRPLLVLASAEACRLDPDSVLPVACAVEAVHTYSLIHDDLPSMDNSDWRRGQPTCHVRYGEAIAVLAGDALHDMAFEWVVAAADRLGPPDRVLGVVLDLARALGTEGMVGGQVLDLLAERGQVPPDWVPEIHRRKTGCLVRACARVGPLLAGDPQALACLTAYGEHLGLAFQITDDVLDVVGHPDKLGKRPGADEAKVTYPKVFGLDAARQLALQEAERAVEALRPLGPRGDLLADLARFVVDRER